MNHVVTRRVLFAAALVLATCLAGCGDSGGREDGGTATGVSKTAPVTKELRRSWALPRPGSLGERERMGHSVAIEGDTAVVGVVDVGTRVRGTFVYRHRDGEWGLWQHLPLQDQGFSPFIPGRETIEICDAAIAMKTMGAVVVYRLERGSWVQDARITDVQMGGEQITGMALGKDILAAAVRTKNNDHVLQVFSRSQAGWSDGAILTTVSESESWGDSLAFHDDLLVVGSGLDSRRSSRGGSATVFRRDGSGWHKEADLVASGGDEYDMFGMNVAVEKNRIVVGAPGFSDAEGRTNGAVYDFSYDGEKWVESQRIVHQVDSRPPIGDNLSLSGDLLLVGSDRANANNSGAVYVYRHNGSRWTLATTILEDPPVAEQGFGFDVDLDSGRAIISSWGRTGMQIGAMMSGQAEETPKSAIQRRAAIYDLDIILPAGT